MYLTPRGQPLDQVKARALADGPGVIAVCGRFEGIDQRVMEAYPGDEISLGDFVLSGGELAAMTLLDACVRLLPGVIGAAGVISMKKVSRPDCWNTRITPVPAIGSGLSVPEMSVALWSSRKGSRLASCSGRGHHASTTSRLVGTLWTRQYLSQEGNQSYEHH